LRQWLRKSVPQTLYLTFTAISSFIDQSFLNGGLVSLTLLHLPLLLILQEFNFNKDDINTISFFYALTNKKPRHNKRQGQEIHFSLPYMGRTIIQFFFVYHYVN